MVFYGAFITQFGQLYMRVTLKQFKDSHRKQALGALAQE
jgi:hypothetical protein